VHTRDAPMMPDRGRLALLRLARTEGVGAVTLGRALERWPDPCEALEALASEAARVRPIDIPSPARAQAELETLVRIGARLVTVLDADYPPLLRGVPGAPPVLTVLGRLELLGRPAVGIIGARNASSGGRTLARRIAEGVGAAGLVVVSGLARGIDAAAHEAALPAGTIAVLAGGIDCIYPPEHQDLADAIAERGVLVTEQKAGLNARAQHFPMRNRIIAALGLGLVVVEAAQRSGTLITARAATQQGREVMAVPGSPLDPRCRGSNGLLREGATLVETAEDVVETLRPIAGADGDLFGFARNRRPAPALPQLDLPRLMVEPGLGERIAELLSATPIHVDALAREAGVGAADCLAVLAELELEGRARLMPGGQACAVLPD